MSYYSGVYSIFHRFIKDYVDSLQPDKTNRYVYCYNNPINLTDPLGLEPEKKTAEEVEQAAAAEKKGDTAPQVAGKMDTPPQEGETAGDVKDKHDVGKKSSVPSIKDRQEARDEYTYADEGLKDRKWANEGYKYADQTLKERATPQPSLAASLLGSLGVAVLDGPEPGPADIVALGLAAGALYQAYRGSQQATPQWLKDTWTSPNNQDMNGGPPWNFRDIPTWMKVVGVSSAVTYLAVEWYWKTRGQDIEEASVAPQQGSRVNRFSTASPPEIKSITHYEPEIKCEYIYAPELKNRSSN